MAGEWGWGQAKPGNEGKEGALGSCHPLAPKCTDTHTHACVLAQSLMFLHAHRLHTGLSSCRSPPGPQALWLPDVQVPGQLRAPTPTLAVHAARVGKH